VIGTAMKSSQPSAGSSAPHRVLVGHQPKVVARYPNGPNVRAPTRRGGTEYWASGPKRWRPAMTRSPRNPENRPNDRAKDAVRPRWVI
jgi:hypothetical protein